MSVENKKTNGFIQEMNKLKQQNTELKKLLFSLHQEMTSSDPGESDCLLTVCSSCKKIRDHDHWAKMESFFKSILRIEFSHGICPECAEKLYPDCLCDFDRN